MKCEQYESCLPACTCTCFACVDGWCDYWQARGGPSAITRGDLRVDLDYIGEGISGDYNPDDPEDVELLRFYVSKYNGWEWIDLDHGSYCTQMTTDLPTKERMAALKTIMDVVESCIDEADGSFKRRMEELSWMDRYNEREPGWSERIT